MSKLIEGCSNSTYTGTYCDEQWDCAKCKKAREHQKMVYLPSVMLKWHNCELSPIDLLNAIPDSVWDSNDSLKVLRNTINNAVEQVDWSNLKGVP